MCAGGRPQCVLNLASLLASVTHWPRWQRRDGWKWKHYHPPSPIPYSHSPVICLRNLAPRPPPSPPLQIFLKLYRSHNKMRFKTSDESPSGLKYTINHIFLPPRLPQADNTSLENELFLAKSLHKSLLGFSKLEPASAEALNPALGIVARFSKTEHITPLIIKAIICKLSNKGKHISHTHSNISG